VKGAVVTAVTPRSLAAKAGIQPGDLVTEVGSKKVSNAQDAKDALADMSLEKGVRLYVNTREGGRFVFLKGAESK
jgi:S1-C subfamily serine protease